MGWHGACDCCGGGSSTVCDILTDDFDRANAGTLGSDWDEDAGTWSISSNEAVTSSNNALAVSSAEMTLNDDFVVSADVDSIGTKIVFDYLDSNNYHEVEFQTTSLIVSKVTSGTPSTLKTITKASSTSGTVRVCVVNTRVVVNLDYPNATVIDSLDITRHDGLQAGIGTNTISGTVAFNNFFFNRYADQSNDSCPSCEYECDTSCCDEVPLEYYMNLTNFNLTDGTKCSGICADISGTYTLQESGDCLWNYFQSGIDCCEPENPGAYFRIFLIFIGGCKFRCTIMIDAALDPDDPEDCGVMFLQYESAAISDSTTCATFGSMTLTETSGFPTGGTACSGTPPSTITLETV